MTSDGKCTQSAHLDQHITAAFAARAPSQPQSPSSCCFPGRSLMKDSDGVSIGPQLRLLVYWCACYHVLFSILPQWGRLCLRILTAGLLSIWKVVSEAAKRSFKYRKKQLRCFHGSRMIFRHNVGKGNVSLAREPLLWELSARWWLRLSHCRAPAALGCAGALLWRLRAMEVGGKADCCSSCSRDKERALLTPDYTSKQLVGLLLSALHVCLWVICWWRWCSCCLLLVVARCNEKHRLRSVFSWQCRWDRLTLLSWEPHAEVCQSHATSIQRAEGTPAALGTGQPA